MQSNIKRNSPSLKSYFEKSNPEASNFDSALTEEIDTSSTTPDASGPYTDYIRNAV